MKYQNGIFGVANFLNILLFKLKTSIKIMLTIINIIISNALILLITYQYLERINLLEKSMY
jgi:hypothetical protein